MPELHVQGMSGLGDCIHQRALLRHWMKTHTVWLRTPWPSVYHDLVGDRLKLARPITTLRTQLKNASREAAKFDVANIQTTTQISYSPALIRAKGSVLAAMAAQCGVPDGSLDFRLPIPAAWFEGADALIATWKTSKPLLLYRPLIERKEWSGCPTRNPDHGAYAELLNSVREDFFVISVADLQVGAEWMVGQPIGADVEYHSGELPFETLAALTSRCDLVMSSPGFAIILAQSVGTPAVCVFGGYEKGSSFSAGAKFGPYLPIEPIRPCDCFKHGHDCDKRIDVGRAKTKLREFVSANHA